jgi:hypothetical protein
MPNIPDISPEICLRFEDVINLLLSSIALEEIALSNVINAESEKLKSVIKKNESSCSVKDLIDLNESIEKVLCEVGSIENLLIAKIKHIDRICDKKDNNECQNSDECCDYSDDFGDICHKCMEEFNCKCNNDCDCKYKENDEEINTGTNNNIEPYKNINNNNFNKSNTYNKNEYYRNYNKIADMFNKILGRGSNKIM